MEVYLNTQNDLFYPDVVVPVNNDTTIPSSSTSTSSSVTVSTSTSVPKRETKCEDIVTKVCKFVDDIPKIPAVTYKEVMLQDFYQYLMTKISPSNETIKQVDFSIEGKLIDNKIYISRFIKKEIKLTEDVKEEVYDVPNKCVSGGGVFEDVVNQIQWGSEPSATNASATSTATSKPNGISFVDEIKQSLSNIKLPQIPKPEQTKQSTNPFTLNPFSNEQPSNNTNSPFSQILNNPKTESFLDGLEQKIQQHKQENFSEKQPSVFSMLQQPKQEKAPEPHPMFNMLHQQPKQDPHSSVLSLDTLAPQVIEKELSKAYEMNNFMLNAINTIPVANDFSQKNVDALFIRNYLSGMQADPESVRCSIIKNLDKIDKNSIFSHVLQGYNDNYYIEQIKRKILGFTQNVSTKDLFDIINAPNSKDKLSFGKDYVRFASPKEFLDYVRSLDDLGKKKRILNTINNKDLELIVEKVNNGYNKTGLANAYVYMGLGFKELVKDLESYF